MVPGELWAWVLSATTIVVAVVAAAWPTDKEEQ
jgi:hypothetical protein